MKIQSTLIALLGTAQSSALVNADRNIDGKSLSVSADRRNVLVERAVCNADNVLRALRNTKVSASASIFCSEYLQETTVLSAVATTVGSTVTTSTTITQTSTTSTTTTTGIGATATVGCDIRGYGAASEAIFRSDDSIGRVACYERCRQDPQCLAYGYGGRSCGNYKSKTDVVVFERDPESFFMFTDKDCPVECNVFGYGMAQYSIEYREDIGSRLQCHERCQATEDCVSYGHGGITCALYGARTTRVAYDREDESIFSFSDIVCPRPAAGAKFKRQTPVSCVSRPTVLPSYIAATLGSSRISSACSCLVTSASPACTIAASTLTVNSGTTTTTTISTVMTVTSVIVSSSATATVTTIRTAF